MKPSNLIRSVFSLAMLAGFTASSNALTFDYETHGGSVVEDTPITYDPIEMWWTPDNPLYCDDPLNTDGTCDHGLGYVKLHPEDSFRLDDGDLDTPPVDAKDFLSGFWSYGLHFEAESPTVEFPGVCWGDRGGLPPTPPFSGVSGETFGGFTGTVTVDGAPELFGILTHFNRALYPEKDAPWGFDSKIDWYLHLEKDGNPVVHKKFVYQLYFYETENLKDPCPRNELGVGVQGNVSVTFHNTFQTPGNTHTHTFFADGVEDFPRNIDGLGCDDATTFSAVPDESDPDWFSYNDYLYKINVHGFYPAVKDNNGEYTGECDLSQGPINTMWSEEETESVGCVLFDIEQLESCNWYWDIHVSERRFKQCSKMFKRTKNLDRYIKCVKRVQRRSGKDRAWTDDLAPWTDFDEAFETGNNCTGNLTMKGALRNVGPLMDIAAALLNATLLDHYYYTVDEVKSKVQDKCSDGELTWDEIIELRNDFHRFNHTRNCPLNIRGPRVPELL